MIDIERFALMTRAERINRCAAISNEIEKLQQSIQCIRSDSNDDSGYERRRKNYEETVAKWQRQLDSLIARHENGPELIEACKAQVDNLQQERLILKNFSELQRLQELYDQLDDQQLRDADIAASAERV